MRCRVRLAVLSTLTWLATQPALADGYAPNVPPPPPPPKPAPPVPGPPFPERLPYRRDQLSPPGYHVESYARPWLPITGGSIFGVFYSLAAGPEAFRTGPECSTDKWLLLPVAGAFIASSYRGGSARGRCDDPEGITAAVYGFDGVGQLIGVAFIGATWVFPKRELVRDADHAPTDSPFTWQFVPVVGSSRAGVGVVGTF